MRRRIYFILFLNSYIKIRGFDEIEHLKKNFWKDYNMIFGSLYLYLNQEYISFIENGINKLPGVKKRSGKLTRKGTLLRDFYFLIKNIEGGGIHPQKIIGLLESIESKIKIKNSNSDSKQENIQEISEQKNKREISEQETSQKIDRSNNHNHILYKLGKIEERLKNIDSKDIEVCDKDKFLEEMNNIYEELNGLEKKLQNISEEDTGRNLIKNFQEILKNKIEELKNKIEELKNKIEELKNKIEELKPKEKLTLVTQETRGCISEVLTDNYTGTKYERFIKYLLSKECFHYKISNTVNPSQNNSQGDGSFSVKIAKHFFHSLENLLKKGKIDLNNTSWSIICEEYFSLVDDDQEVRSFLNILKDYNEKGDFIDIFSYFKDAVDRFGESGRFNKDTNKGSLVGVKELLDFILYKKIPEIEEKYKSL